MAFLATFFAAAGATTFFFPFLPFFVFAGVVFGCAGAGAGVGATATGATTAFLTFLPFFVFAGVAFGCAGAGAGVGD